MYKETNDYELLYLIAESNEDAYNSMHNKYHNIVQIEANKCYKKLPYIGISYDDLYQAGLYGLELAIKFFDEKSDTLFYTFASTFIKREMYTYIKYNSRNKHHVLSQSISLDSTIGEDGTLNDIIPSNSNSIDEYFENCKNRAILDLKYELSFFQSLVYELKLNHFTNKEISVLLDVPYKTVDNSISGIKNRLRRMKNKIEQCF